MYVSASSVCVCVWVWVPFIHNCVLTLLFWGLWRWQIASKSLASKGHYELSSLSVFSLRSRNNIFLYWNGKSSWNLQIPLWLSKVLPTLPVLYCDAAFTEPLSLVLCGYIITFCIVVKVCSRLAEEFARFQSNKIFFGWYLVKFSGNVGSFISVSVLICCRDSAVLTDPMGMFAESKKSVKLKNVIERTRRSDIKLETGSAPAKSLPLCRSARSSPTCQTVHIPLTHCERASVLQHRPLNPVHLHDNRVTEIRHLTRGSGAMWPWSQGVCVWAGRILAHYAHVAQFTLPVLLL